ncbi:MAG: glycosyltransferase family 2 protein [Hydrogenophaga sp.]|nr:glycosyltransferase family 2 protein [Hydrogenophaga sp.]
MTEIPAAAAAGAEPLASVLIPAKNETGNIGALVGEVVAALRPECAFEIVLVDDGSDDGTGEEFLQRCQALGAAARLIRHQKSVGQSTALMSAARQAAGKYLITIDGDGQNDPADMPALLRAAREAEAQGPHFCIAGYRKNRQDTEWKKFQSRIANAVRQRLLEDQVPDTGCGLKLIPRATWLQLPYFDHMHRYLPALVLRIGGHIKVVPVNHRARQAGVSKYNAWNRLWVGLVDMVGVMWLIRRGKRPVIEQVRTLAAHEESR